jgi:GPI inositol-deacylase-like protein
MRLALRELQKEAGESNDDKITKTLDRAYMQAMERIELQTPEHRELARQVLSWITCAKRRLTSSELQHAIAVEVNKREFDTEDIELIVSVCVGLVVIDEESDIIRLVHYTAQEYFERTWERWFPNAHTDITKTCCGPKSTVT